MCRQDLEWVHEMCGWNNLSFPERLLLTVSLTPSSPYAQKYGKRSTMFACLHNNGFVYGNSDTRVEVSDRQMEMVIGIMQALKYPIID